MRAKTTTTDNAPEAPRPAADPAGRRPAMRLRTGVRGGAACTFKLTPDKVEAGGEHV